MTPGEWQAVLGMSIWIVIMTSAGAISIALKRRRQRRAP